MAKSWMMVENYVRIDQSQAHLCGWLLVRSTKSRDTWRKTRVCSWNSMPRLLRKNGTEMLLKGKSDLKSFLLRQWVTLKFYSARNSFFRIVQLLHNIELLKHLVVKKLISAVFVQVVIMDFRQIMGTKENLEKWADEQYKNSSQSYEKIVRKPRTCLAKAEREEIARFITKHK